MNIRRPPAPLAGSERVRAEVARIEHMWEECLAASGGPFLLGDFCNADAMDAPVVNRLEIYCLSDHPVVRSYGDAMKGLEAWQAWEEASRSEPWVLEEEEV